jgi:hemoglobin-like flavoprotein
VIAPDQGRRRRGLIAWRGEETDVVCEADIEVIRESLPDIRRHLDAASERFYVNLFTLAPELRALFPPDMADQGMRFMSTLVTMADLFDDPDAFAAGVERLARVHARAGVRAAHFAPMGHALLVTLGEVMGPAFTSPLQQAWRGAYDHIAAAMIARAGSA